MGKESACNSGDPGLIPERSAVKHMGFPLYIASCFSLEASNMPSLCLVFVSLFSMCLVLFLLGLILCGLFVPLEVD